MSELFKICEKGNRFYNLKEYDRALYYYEKAINEGYDGLQIIQRAQKLKDQGIKPKPPINVWKARALLRVRQEGWRQFVFAKVNYPLVLVKSLENFKSCTLAPDEYEVDENETRISFLHQGKEIMRFDRKDEMNLHVTCQYFTEMEKYRKVTIVDGKKILMPAKRLKYHFFITYDSFTDLLVQLRRVQLLEETYYEDHRNDLLDMINNEFGNYSQEDIKTLGDQFVYWVEVYSVLHELFRNHTPYLEIDYLKEYINEMMEHYLEVVEKGPIYKIDYFYMILVFLERLYRRFPAEDPGKYSFIYEKYLVCRKFSEVFSQFLEDASQNIINEPMFHGFYKYLGQFRQNLFK